MFELMHSEYDLVLNRRGLEPGEWNMVNVVAYFNRNTMIDHPRQARICEKSSEMLVKV